MLHVRLAANHHRNTKRTDTRHNEGANLRAQIARVKPRGAQQGQQNEGAKSSKIHQHSEPVALVLDANVFPSSAAANRPQMVQIQNVKCCGALRMCCNGGVGGGGGREDFNDMCLGTCLADGRSCCKTTNAPCSQNIAAASPNACCQSSYRRSYQGMTQQGPLHLP